MKEELQCVASSSYSLLSFYSSFPSPSLSPSFLSFLAAIIYNVKGNIFNLFFSIYSDSLCKSLPFVAQSVRICLQCKRPGFDPWVKKIPWRRKWQPTLVSLPGKSHGQRGLRGWGPWGCKGSGMTEWLTLTYLCRILNRQGTFYYSESEVAQSCLTLCDPMDCRLSGSSVHGLFQARVLEWIAISFSRGSSQPRNRTQVSRITGRRFTVWATREALKR